MLPLVAPSIIEQSATGTSGPRIGNRHPVYVPNGCFPCIGEDQWITLARAKRPRVAIAMWHHASP